MEGIDADSSLGAGTYSIAQQSAIPVRAAPNKTFASLALGREHTCGLTSEGVAWCFGRRKDGRLGDGQADDYYTEDPAVKVDSGSVRFASLAAGPRSTCGLDKMGAAYCWGASYFGETGDGKAQVALKPVPVSGGLSFGSLGAGDYYFCGQVPYGTPDPSPPTAPPPVQASPSPPPSPSNGSAAGGATAGGSTADQSSSASSTPVGAIVGGVVGGLAALAVLAFLALKPGKG
ncbi:hypothetical protein ABPG75_011961 [Micractinium tetrahymenae]